MNSDSADAGAPLPPGAGLPASEARARTSRRNFVLGVLNGTIGTASFDFIHPELILAGLVYALTGSKLLVALVSVINKGASLLPQLYISSHLEHRPRKRPFYVALMFVRAASATVLIYGLWRLMEEASAAAFGIFFTGWLLTSLCGGASYVIMLDMVGRLIPLKRVGNFFGVREFMGGLLSLGAGYLVVQPILDLPGYQLPEKYFGLGIVGAVLALVAMLMLAMCREEAGPRARQKTTVMESLRRGYGWLKADRNYRSYLWLRVAFRINDLAFAFFIPYGVDRLRYEHDPAGVVALGGLLLATFKLSRVVTSTLWGWTVDRYGDRTCLVWTGLCFTLGPVLALAAPLLPQLFEAPIPLTNAVIDLPLCVYFLALVAIGGGVQGSIIGGNRFLISNAPPHRRLSYVGFLNTVTSPLTLLPLAAGYLAAEAGITTLFVVLVGGGLMWMFWAWRMTPDRHGYLPAADPNGADPAFTESDIAP